MPVVETLISGFCRVFARFILTASKLFLPHVSLLIREPAKCLAALTFALNIVCFSALGASATSEPAADDPLLVPTARATYADYLKWQAAPKSAAPKIGLALGGGGARGAAHVGVLEVLLKEGIKFDYISGTSIGSIVGGLYSAGVPVTKIQEDFETGSLMKHFMPVSLPVRLVLAPVIFVPRLFGAKPYDGLYKGNIFRKYLDSNLPADGRKIENLKIPFAAVSLNILDGKPYMIRGGDLGYAMQASSAVPGLRKPVEIGGKLFVDGGVVCNLPVKQCREMGADIVIAVNIDEPFHEDQLESFRKPGSVTRRMLKWDLYTIDEAQENIADINIHPDTEGVTLITTSKSAARKAFEMGQKAAREALPEIRKKIQALQLVEKEKVQVAPDLVQSNP
jgi:NTE family protein